MHDILVACLQSELKFWHLKKKISTFLVENYPYHLMEVVSWNFKYKKTKFSVEDHLQKICRNFFSVSLFGKTPNFCQNGLNGKTYQKLKTHTSGEQTWRKFTVTTLKCISNFPFLAKWVRKTGSFFWIK